MHSVEIDIDDPRADDVRALLERHLAFANKHSPPQDVHALNLDDLLDPAITFFTARRDSQLLAIGALKQLEDTSGELKSMHTIEAARRQGIGRAMVEHLLEVARARGYRQVSIETGSTDPFVPARSLYASCGFTRCEPFGDYREGPNSTCMTIELG